MLIAALIIAFLVAWILLYHFVIRPKLVAYRYTAGIYLQLNDWEHDFWSRTILLLKGLKVAIIGLVTSSSPVLIVAYDRLNNVDWTKVLPDERAQVVAGVLVGLGIIGPIIMVWLHQNAIADASAVGPVEAPSTIPPSGV